MSQPTTYLDDLRALAAAVTVLSDHSYQVLGQPRAVAYQQSYTRWAQPLQHFGQNHGDDNQLRANLRQQLTADLYATFYVAGTTAPEPALTALAASPPAAEREQAHARLSAANTTRPGYDPAWTVYSLDAHGNAFVNKNGELRQLQPNQWEATAPGPLQVGSVVRLLVRKEEPSPHPVFYYVHSQATMPQPADLVRVYFNTTFEGAEVLVRELTTTFNRYGLPFMFKCLNHASLFTRVDSAVLYLSKADVGFASTLLRPVLRALASHLKPAVPLFTRLLRPGVGFSEDPANGQSFGMSRCELLAQGLLAAHDRGTTPGEAQLADIERVFAKNGIDIAHMYRNANSYFPYPLDSFACEHAPA